MKDRCQISIDNIVQYLNAIPTLSNNIQVSEQLLDRFCICRFSYILFDLIFVKKEFNPCLKLGNVI